MLTTLQSLIVLQCVVTLLFGFLVVKNGVRGNKEGLRINVMCFLVLVFADIVQLTHFNR